MLPLIRQSHLFVSGALLVLAIATPAWSQETIHIKAYSGEPFGVGMVTIRFPANDDTNPAVNQLEERGDRAFYPTFELSPRIMEPIAVDWRFLTVYFLFQGGEPLELSLFSKGELVARVEPVSDSEAHKHLLGAWWRHYQVPQKTWNQDNYPRVLENYLTMTLARRLELDPPSTKPARLYWEADVEQAVAFFLGAESVRAAMQKKTMLNTSGELENADQPLPAGIEPPAVVIPEHAQDVAIEPIAMHVPAECFYIRFGSFANFRWLRSKLDRWGGDLRSLIAVRGLDYEIQARLERRLALKETVLSKLLGDTVIADVAIIGRRNRRQAVAMFRITFVRVPWVERSEP